LFESQDPDEVLALHITFTTALFRRVQPLIPTIRAAIAADADVARDWRANAGQNRYDGMAAVMGHLSGLGALRGELVVARATDIVWTMLSFETYEALVIERGWLPDEFAAWARDALRATILKPPSASG
jgi:hypothetical protein